MKLAIVSILITFSFSMFSADKVVYGEDNRVEVLNSPYSQYQEYADSTLAMFTRDKFIYDENSEEYILRGATLGERKKLCAGEKFFDQISMATCSSFLVGEDLVVTAGHCIKNQIDCDRFQFVFDYYQTEDVMKEFRFPKENVYGCSEVIEQRKTALLDYALVRLDRKILDRKPLAYRKSGKIKKKTEVISIGQPSGLPTKIVDSGKVRKNFWSGFFSVNLDIFGGNSGSAVINVKSGEVEGIIVRGEIDYIYDEPADCFRVKRCKERRCRGEEATRITKIKYLMNL